MKKLLLTAVAALVAFATSWAANPTLYLRGDISGTGWPATSAYKFTEDNGVYTLNLAKISGSFKIADANWSDAANFSTNNMSMELGKEYSVFSGSSTTNMKMAEAANNVTITFDINTKKLKVEGQATTVEVSYALHGQLTNANWATTAMTKDATATPEAWTFTCTPAVPVGKTLVVRQEDGNNVDYYKAASASTKLEPGGSVTLSTSNSNDLNYSLETGKEYTFTYVPSTGVLSVNNPQGGVTYPENIYVLGNVDNKAFAPGSTVALAKGDADGVYTGEVTFTGADDTEYSYFQLCTENGSSWATLGTRYGAEAADADPTAGTVTLTYNDFSWKVDNATYDVTVNLAELTMTVVKKETPVPPVPVTPDIYLRGAISGTAWPADDAFKFTADNGVYTLSIPALSGEFKISTDDWNDEYTYSANNTAMELGTDYDVTSGGMTGNMCLAKPAKNVTVTLDTNTSKIRIEGEEDVEIITYAINSSLTEETWSLAEMTEGDNGEWTYTVTPVNAEGELLVQKMVNGAAKDYFKAAATDLLTAGTSVTLSTANTGNLKYELTDDTEYTFTFNPATGVLSVEGAEVPPVPSTPDLYLRGAISGTAWPADDAFKFTADNGVYTLSIPALSGEFKISTDDWNDEYTYSANNTAMELGTDYDVTSGGMTGNMCLAKPAKNVTVTLDTNTSKIRIEGEEDVEIITYAINSSLTEETWSLAEMTEGNNGEWTYTVTPVIAEGELLVQKMVNGAAKDYFKATATDLLEAGKSVVLSTANTANLKYKLSLETEYTFSFDPATSTLAVTNGLSGIEGVEADADNAPVYYNLQGVRVAAPAEGLYIVVRGDKVAKEYVK